MKTKGKRIIGILFSIALMFAVMPVLGLSQTAYADVDTWSENKSFDSDASFESGVDVTNDITITIAEGKTVRVENGIYAGGKTLTVEGKGNLIVNGSNSRYGSGGSAFTGSIIVKGGKVTLTGGEGNPEGEHDTGGNGIEGNVEVRGGLFSATGGNGYTVGQAVSDTITCENGIVAQESANGSEWSDISGTNPNKQYVRTIQTYPLWVGGTRVTSANASNIDGYNKASYDDTTHTLTLNGYIYSGKSEGVKYTGDGELKIVLTGTNEITSSEGNGGINGGNYGILTFSGTGSLSVNSSTGMGAIYTVKDITVESGNVTAVGSITGVRSESGNVTVNDGTITASGRIGILAKDITIGGGSVNATGAYGGIESYGNVIIDGGTLEASGMFGVTGENVTINGGTVNATGTESDFHWTSMGAMAHYDPAGIFAEETAEITGGKVTAAGDGYGILGTVKNHIKGTGWSDKAGTADKTAIEIIADGQDLSMYKKVQFPEFIDKVTVKFDSAGGSAVKAQTINKGAKATKPADPKKSGYTFDGWYNGKKAFDFNTAVNENITLTAHWKENVKPTPAPTTKPTKKPTPKPTTPKRTTKPTAKPAPAKVSGMPMAKITAKGKTSLEISWNKIKGAAGYDIFFSNCGYHEKKACKKIKTIKGNKTFKWTKTGLRKRIAYKAYVKAYVVKNGKKVYVRTSPIMHAYTGNGTKNYTNARSLTVNKSKVTLKKGKAFKVKANISKVDKNKKLMPKGHDPVLRYMTSNKKVATVSPSGKIIAKGKGSCTVVAFAHNGVSKAIKVTVK